MRDFQFPGRSPIRVTEAAAAAVLAVVEPQSTGIGGDCFVLYAPRGGPKVIAFNGSGRSPDAAKFDWYHDHGFREFPTYGPHAVTIPGAIDAWARIVADHGRRELGALLQPAIGFAEDGYVVLDRVAFDWALTADRLASDPHAARIFLPQGRAPRPGERHRQPELAATLRAVAAAGRDGFYKGAIAEDMVGHLKALGGLHDLEDFAKADGEYVRPVSTSYRGTDIYQMPPNNQGLTALIMLNILSGFELAGRDPMGADRLHLEIEAGRLAYRDRNALIADPAHVDVPVARILSAAHAGELRSLIDPD